MNTQDALQKAQQEGMDLIVVAEMAQPPVAKIIEFSKFKYQQTKKTKSGTTKTKSTEVKEVRFTPFMAQNDFNNRLDRVKEFLSNGHKVKLVVKFSGRQISRREFGIKVLDQAITSIKDVATIEQEPKWQGKLYFVQVKPKQIQKNETKDQN